MPQSTVLKPFGSLFLIMICEQSHHNELQAQSTTEASMSHSEDAEPEAPNI